MPKLVEVVDLTCTDAAIVEAVLRVCIDRTRSMAYRVHIRNRSLTRLRELNERIHNEEFGSLPNYTSTTLRFPAMPDEPFELLLELPVA